MHRWLVATASCTALLANRPFSYCDESRDHLKLNYGVKLAVFSGGTGFNSIARKLNQEVTTNVSHILPVSDNGGSSEEIRKALGGVAVGDIRSRLVRIASEGSIEALAVKELLQYRLPMDSCEKSRDEWNQLLEGKHKLWEGISDPYKDTIRGFLLHFHHAVMKQAPNFDFRNGSVGNFFFAGAWVDLSSIEAAIFLVGSVLRIPEKAAVIPVSNSRQSLTLGAILEDGSTLLGQTNISHPSHFPDSVLSHLIVDKEKAGQESMSSRISKIFYVNDDLQKTEPRANPRVIQHLKDAQHIIYSMGSLYTSIIPTLILKEVGETIASRGPYVSKIFILNGYKDRETDNMTAVDFVMAITNALNRYGELANSPSSYITDMVVMQETDIQVDIETLQAMGIKVHIMKGVKKSDSDKKYLYNPKELVQFFSNLSRNQ
jgi:2-phospho-L-lactate transferase/gluconeogenesis factor (CofD/UPF0052 family)